MKKKIPVFSIIIVCLTISIAFTAFIVFLEHRNSHEQLKILMNNQADQMTNRVNSALQEVYAVQGLVLGDNAENYDLSIIGEFLIRDEFREFVRNVLIAPDGVVSQVYPLEGNEDVLGLDLYSDENASSNDAIKARDSGKLIVSGPFDLVQGGKAISGRLAVKIPQSDGTFKDWGLVSITLSFPEVMECTATNTLINEGYDFQVLKRDDSTEEYIEILNHNFTSYGDYESIYFSIQNMNFEIKAAPESGWFNRIRCISLFGLSSVIFIIFGFAVFLLGRWQQALHAKATIDALTGAVNRSAGESQINKNIKSKGFANGAFLLLDIDHFKSVNDTLGHQIGDELLVESAKIFKRLFRSTDTICRLGGDEFVIFLTFEKSHEFLYSKITQLLDAMRRNITHEDKVVTISCSVGIALVPQDAATFDSLYEKADKALYASKEAGRDQATFYSDEL